MIAATRKHFHTHRRTWLRSGLALAAGALVVWGCSFEGEHRPPGQGTEPIGLASGPCSAGEERVCGITLSQENGTASCFRGTQVCEEGTWSGCQDGHITEEIVPESTGENNTQAISSPAICTNNPCDPGCMYFDEDPPDISAGGSSPGAPIAGPPPDWSTPPTTAGCGHELCTEGAGLDPTCHWCVDDVCAANAACCNTGDPSAWDATCISLVYTACSGLPAPAPADLCDYSAFGESSVRLGNGSTGYPTIGSEGWVRPETNGQLGPIFAQGLVDLRNGGHVEGNVTTEGAVWVESPSTVHGDIWAGGRVDIRNNVVIGDFTGMVGGSITAVGEIEVEAGGEILRDLWSGGEIDLKTNAEIFGSTWSYLDTVGQSGSVIRGDATVRNGYSIDSNINVWGTEDDMGTVSVPVAPVVQLPDLDDYRRDVTAACTAAGSSTNYTTAADVTLPPGIYGNITVHGGNTLTLQDGGSYVFRNIQSFANGNIRLAGSGPWDITICNQFYTDTSTTVYLDGTSTPPNPADFIVYVANSSLTDCVSLGDNTTVNGLFIAPDCRVRMYNNVTFEGAAWAREVYTNTGIDFIPLDADDCRAIPKFGSAVCDGTTLMYTDGNSYSDGDIVHFNGFRYECRAGQSANCSAGGGFGDGTGAPGFWPGLGDDWFTAWEYVDECPDQQDPGGGLCPIDLEIPGVPTHQEPCYSGLDCQVNSSCTEVLTDASCGDHSKCATGTPLDISCADECVQRICASRPECCWLSWDSTCVDLVETTCDASCGAFVSAGCAHDACVVGTALDSSCDSAVANVCAQPGFAYCCDTGTPDVWDANCVEELYIQETGSGTAPNPPALTSLCDYAMMGRGSAALTSAAVTGNVAWTNGTISSTWSTIAGHVVMDVGAGTFHDTTIGGDLWGSSTMTTTGSTSYYNKYESLGDGNVPLAVIPEFDPPACSTYSGWYQPINSDMTAGHYGQVQIQSDITLGPGDYYLKALEINNGVTVTLPASGDVRIWICGNAWARVRDNAQIVSPSSDPHQLQVWLEQGNVEIMAGADAWGMFRSGDGPNNVGGTVALGTSATVHGLAHSYWGATTLASGAFIDNTGFSRTDCLLDGFDPAAPAPPVCPVTTPLSDTVVETGTCADNPDGYQVSTSICADVDLSLDMPCDDEIPVCNHGNTDLPANEAEIVFYPRSSGQFSVAPPETGWAASTCPITDPVPAGSCVLQACPAVTEDMTALIELTSSATVSECSELDNWSYYPQSQACVTSGGSPPMEVEVIEDYEATCPDNSAPLWGLLSWETTTPGDSSVTFEAETSFDGTFTNTYTQLGVAETNGGMSGMDDTSSCPISSPLSECPVDVTGELGLGMMNHPHHLRLRARVTPDGFDSPILHDWQITYSCVVDQ